MESRLSLPTVDAPREVPLYTGNIAEDMIRVSRARLADQITGGLSRPGKMPCPSWGISALRCRTGARLAEVAGTVCHDCYALKRNYARQTVQAKLEERYEGLFHPLWTPAMAFLVNYYCDEYFRLFDSGDLQGANHLKNIAQMARAVPHVRIWMPTREVETVRTVQREQELPENLIVRVSANLIDGARPRGFPHTSAVVTGQENASCEAQLNGNKCGDCRACWEDEHVTYPLH